MRSSHFGRAATAALLTVLALVTAMLPASAIVTSITFVPSSAGNPDATLVEYILDESSPKPSSPCGVPVSRADTVTLSVSASGLYRFSDVRANGAYIPPEFSSSTAGRFTSDGLAMVSLGDTCIGIVDDRASFDLVAGQQYRVSLANLLAGPLGNFGYLINGPGEVTVNGVGPGLTAERALAACQEGSDAPAGYTLREGTAKSETLVGTSGNDVIRGLAGNDTIRGLGGDDILCGGEGQDTIQGGDGDDFVFGEASQDVLSGGIGEDYLDGGVGNDVVNGGDGGDALVGGEGQDTLRGDAGDDELVGGAGNDVLDGGAGTDVGTDTDPRSVFRNIETVNGPPAPGPQPTSTATR